MLKLNRTVDVIITNESGMITYTFCNENKACSCHCIVYMYFERSFGHGMHSEKIVDLTSGISM